MLWKKNLKKKKKSKIVKEVKEVKDECVVCMDELVEVTFKPCGHKVCCNLCSKQLDKCPICRSFLFKKPVRIKWSNRFGIDRCQFCGFDGFLSYFTPCRFSGYCLYCL